MSDDGLPSLRRPMAWETPGRSRQLTSPHLSDSGSVHSDEAYGRSGSPSCWRPVASRDLYQTGTVSPGPGPGRRQLVEAQEQLRLYKEELAKKERLIAALTSYETPRTRNSDGFGFDDMLGGNITEELSDARSHVAALQAKVDGLQSQLHELTHQLELRDARIGEFVAAQDVTKDTAQRQADVILSLRQRITECEAQCTNLEGVAGRKDIVISTLERERHDDRQRIVDLETQLRLLTEKQNTVKHRSDHIEQCFANLGIKLNINVGAADGGPPAVDLVISKVEELLSEHKSHHSQLESLKSSLESLHQDDERHHQTIAKLSAERDELLRKNNTRSEDFDQLRQQREASEQHVHQLEHEIEQLNGRMHDLEHARAAAQYERDEFHTRVEQLEHERSQWRSRAEQVEHELRSRHESAEHGESRLSTLIKNLVSLLAITADDHAEDAQSESEIVERVRHVMHSLRDKSARIDLLEHKVADLTHELESRRAQPAVHPDSLLQLEKRLQRAEEELAAGDVLRDNLRVDKEKFLRFLEIVSRSLGMDTTIADLGLDGATDAVLVRAEQLSKNEATALAKRKSQVYGLNRKLKVLKDQLDSKDVHLELLRKKNISLEERLSSKTELERAKDEESVRSRKLMKLAEKYKRELNELHVEVRDLRARLLHSTEIQGRNGQLEHDIEKLQAEMHRLEHVRQQQAAAIDNLQESVGTATNEHGRKRDQATNTINALTSELRTTKQALEDVSKRERQLVDLRDVVARMLGLSIDTLAVPDYELVARLEQLILANQTNAATAFALDGAFHNVGDGFHAGYRNAGRVMTGGHAGVVAGIPGVQHHRRRVDGLS